MIAAGKLFAEYGFDAVSTRAIAEKARVTLGCIHYHFGSKENLYFAACSKAMRAKRNNGFCQALEENPALLESPEGQAELIRNVVHRSFYEYFLSDKPKWERQILVREVVHPSSAMPRIAEHIFKPDVLATRSFLLQIKPSATDEEVATWMDLLHAQIFFYSAAEEALCFVRGKESMNQAFFQQAARAVSRAMILLMQLPLPRDLREN